MKYRLIDKSGNEFSCTKMQLNGFDYYISSDMKMAPDTKYKSIEENPRRIVEYSKYFMGFLGNPILCTNDKNSDIPQVSDYEVQPL